MEEHYSNVDIAFHDLCYAHNELLRQRKYPTFMRRKFSEYILLSQQLTEFMRKEFSASTAKKWSAGNFKEWNATTNFLKTLRNHIAHEGPLPFYETVTIAFVKGFVESPIGIVRPGNRYDFVCLTNFTSQQVGKIRQIAGADIIKYHDNPGPLSLSTPTPSSNIEPKVLFVRYSRAQESPPQYRDKDLFLPRRIFLDYKIPLALQNPKISTSALELIKSAHQTYIKYYLFYKNELNKNRQNN